MIVLCAVSSWGRSLELETDVDAAVEQLRSRPAKTSLAMSSGETCGISSCGPAKPAAFRPDRMMSLIPCQCEEVDQVEVFCLQAERGYRRARRMR